MRPFSLYVHIPYCQAKCPYCDFNSYAAQQWPETEYVDALCAEMRHYAQRPPWNDAQVQTVFFGGGTPSLFAPASIATILNQAAGLWRHAPDVEVTLEANPGTVSRDKLAALRAVGVNRMSFGVQSFAARHLRTLGRIHSAEEARVAVRSALHAGFDNVSVDLIFALPEQTLEEWESDLADATRLGVHHISAYNLTYEEGTPFHHWRAQGTLRQLPEETEVAMFTRTQGFLGAAGYQQYEVSNYARPGYACRHNLNYWRAGEYLGVGAGAHSYQAPSTAVAGAGEVDGGWGWRWNNEKNPGRFMQAVATQGHARIASEALDERQARGEFVFLGLRCRDGVPAAAFQQRFGTDLPAAFPRVVDLCDAGLLQHTDGRWRLTPHGLLLADSVFATFV